MIVSNDYRISELELSRPKAGENALNQEKGLFSLPSALLGTGSLASSCLCVFNLLRVREGLGNFSHLHVSQLLLLIEKLHVLKNRLLGKSILEEGVFGE